MKLYLKEQYPGREFWLTNKHPVEITNNAVEIQPSKFDERWRIDTDKDPPVCVTYFFVSSS